MKKFILFTGILGLCGCRQNSLIPDPEGYACGKVITKRYLSVTAPVAYAKGIDSYYIEGLILNGPTSTTDSTTSREISIFCNLPDEYKVVGKLIKFDGSFAQINDTTGSEGAIKKLFKTQYAYHLSINKIY